MNRKPAVRKKKKTKALLSPAREKNIKKYYRIRKNQSIQKILNPVTEEVNSSILLGFGWRVGN